MIGCSPISGGPKQFIMSVPRMGFTSPTGRRVRAMVDQLPNRGREAEMLDEMGLSSMEDLFADIPSDVRFKGELPLPAPQSEEEIIRDARRLLGANADMGSRPSFLGAGLYRNYVPAAVFQLVTRGEFLTAYTPYQPEVSQGMLQAMWEFQTLISELVGLPHRQSLALRRIHGGGRGADLCGSCPQSKSQPTQHRLRFSAHAARQIVGHAQLLSGCRN